MDRSIYNDGQLVDQRQLRRTEDTLTYHLLRRFQDGMQGGVITGLTLTTNVSMTDRFDVAVGMGYARDGELIEVLNPILAQPLSAPAQDNLVVLFYDEVETDRRPHETNGTALASAAYRSYRIEVLSEADFDALPDTDDSVSNSSKGTALIIGIIPIAAQLSGGLDDSQFILPTPLGRILTIDQPTNVSGVTIVGIDVDTQVSSPTSLAVLDWTFSGTTLAYTEPGQSAGTPVTINGDGQFTLASGGSGRTVTIDVVQNLLPTADASDSLTVAETYPDPSEYPTNASGLDGYHRDFRGTPPTTENPHGLRTENLIDVVAGVMGIPATVVFGKDLLATTADKLIPRAFASHGSGRTLLLRSEYSARPGSPNFRRGSVRVYRNDSDLGALEIVTNARWDGTQWVRDVSSLQSLLYSILPFQAGGTGGSDSADADIRTLKRYRTSSDTWNDAQWDTQVASFTGGVRLGTNLMLADGPDVPRIVTDRANQISPGDRTLAWQLGVYNDPANTHDVRFYRVQETGSPDLNPEGMEFTVNAVQASSGASNWTSDDSSEDSMKIFANRNLIEIAFRAASAGTWTDNFAGGGWDNRTMAWDLANDLCELSDQRFGWVNTTTGAAGANPGSGLDTGHRNRLMAMNTPKAWAYVETGGTPSLLNGFNIDPTITFNGDNLVLDFSSTFASGDMSNVNYCVTVTNMHTSAVAEMYQAIVVNAGQFEVACFDDTGIQVDLSSTTRRVGVVVFGEQTT